MLFLTLLVVLTSIFLQISFASQYISISISDSDDVISTDLTTLVDVHVPSYDIKNKITSGEAGFFQLKMEGNEPEAEASLLSHFQESDSISSFDEKFNENNSDDDIYEETYAEYPPSQDFDSTIETSQRVVLFKLYPDLFMRHIKKLAINRVKEVVQFDPFIMTSDGKNLMHHALIQENFELFLLLPRNIEYLLSADVHDKYCFEYLKLIDYNQFFLDQIFDIFITSYLGSDDDDNNDNTNFTFRPITALKRLFCCFQTVTSNLQDPKPEIPIEVFERFVMLLNDRGRADLLSKLLSTLSHSQLGDSVKSSELLFFINIITKDYEKIGRFLRNNPYVTFNGMTILHFALKYSDDARLLGLVPRKGSYLALRDSKGKLASDHINIPTKETIMFSFSRLIKEFKKVLISFLNENDSERFDGHFPELKKLYLCKKSSNSNSISTAELENYQNVAVSLLNVSLSLKLKDCFQLECFLIFTTCIADLRLETLDLVHSNKLNVRLGNFFNQFIELDRYSLVEFILKINPFVAYEGKNIFHFAAHKKSMKLFEIAIKINSSNCSLTLNFDENNNLPLNYLKADMDSKELAYKMMSRFLSEFDIKVDFLKFRHRKNVDGFDWKGVIDKFFESLPSFYSCVKEYESEQQRHNNRDLFSEFLSKTRSSLLLEYIFYKCVVSKNIELTRKVLLKDSFVSYLNKTILHFAIEYDSFELFEAVPQNSKSKYFKYFSTILSSSSTSLSTPQNTKIICSTIHYEFFIKYFSDLSALLEHVAIINVLQEHLFTIDNDDIFSSFLRIIFDFDTFHGSRYGEVIRLKCPKDQRKRFAQLLIASQISYDQVKFTFLLGYGYNSHFMTQLIEFHKSLAADHFLYENLGQFSLRWKSKSDEKIYRKPADEVLFINNLGRLDCKKFVKVDEAGRNVDRVQHKETKQIYAIKTYTARDLFEDECHILSNMDDDSSYLCKAFSFCQQESTWKILFEHVKLDSRKYAVAASEKELEWISAQLFLGLEHLHWLGIVHADIKPDNVMITGSGRVKIIDFGLSLFLPSNDNYHRGTSITIAPEIVRLVPGKYDESVDWWSYGSTVAIWYGIKYGYTDFYEDGYPYFVPFYLSKDRSEYTVSEVPRNFSKNLRSFLRIFFQPNPEARRLNTRRLLNQIRKEPFFKNIDWSKLEGGILPEEQEQSEDNSDKISRK